MAKKIQVTLTGNESKRLIALAAAKMDPVRRCLDGGHRLLLAGGSTVSALAELLGFGPMRISGRIDASGTRTALRVVDAPHNLLIQKGEAHRVDADIRETVADMGRDDLILVGANAIDPMGRAALMFASLRGGSRGYALEDAQLRGVPILVLCGLNKLIPDVDAALRVCDRTDVTRSMGAAVSLYGITAPIVTEIRAIEILCGLEAVAVGGSGIADGEGTRTFLLLGEEENLSAAWQLISALKGAELPGDRESLVTCIGGCAGCARHTACVYKEQAMKK